MTRMLRAEEVIDKLLDRMAVVSMCSREDDVFALGRIQGLKDAVKEVQSCY